MKTARRGLPEADLSYRIIAAAIEVHRKLGSGLLESEYRACMVHELRIRSLRVEVERPVPVRYKDLIVQNAYRADLVIEEAILVELKAVEKLLPAHEAQLLTYLRLCNLKVGLLINFHALAIRSGLRRLLNTHFKQ